jgi:hypothetical protein
MPHEPRGPCENCHTVKTCGGPAGSAAALGGLPQLIPSITRSSLLPHRFAGLCMNCHAILGGAPLPISKEHVARLKLTPEEQILVRAGQRVEVPSVFQDIKAPLLARDAVLPHSFRGVCSNCHSVVHAGSGPSQEMLLRGLTQARQRLVAQNLPDREIAFAGSAPIGPTRRVLQYVSGALALLMFLVSMVYIGMKVLVRKDKKYRKLFNMKRWFQIHEWSSYLFALFAVLHWLLSEQGNSLLHLSLVLIVALTLSGLGFRYKILAKANKKRMRWVHTQQTMAYVLVFLMVAGHLLLGN